MREHQVFDLRNTLEFEPDHAVTIAACRHAFHHSCAAKWVERHRWCPLCTAPFAGYTAYAMEGGINAPVDNFTTRNLVRNIVGKIAGGLIAPTAFTDDEFVHEIRDRIARTCKQYFHVGSTWFLMNIDELDIHIIVNNLRDTNVKFTLSSTGVVLFPWGMWDK